MNLYTISQATDIIAYHASDQPVISQFYPYSHFGTEEQAKNKAEILVFEHKELGEDITPTIYEVSLRLNNPKYVGDVGDDAWGVEIREAEAEGYDGIIYENTFEGEGTSYLVFNPDTIKTLRSFPWEI